jgi:hypothetical protein
MHPFLAKLPLVRRPFHQRDLAYRARDLAVGERDDAIRERDAAIRECDRTARERDAAIAARDAIRRELEDAGLDDPTSPPPDGSQHRDASGAGVHHAVKEKIFCIGMGKTGTTSLEAFFRELGFTLGNQNKAEDLLEDWAVRNFTPIVAFARSAQVFQDIPFSLPYTYAFLDRAYPDARFILSVRDDAEQWYASVIRFIIGLVGKGRLPTEDDLKEFVHRHKGWLLHSVKLIYGVCDESPFDKAQLTRVYEGHNAAVQEYFRHRPGALLTINLREQDAAQKVMEFLGLPYGGETMPHLNRSA